MAKLTDLQVKALSKPGRYSDGLGLYLKVAPLGSKSWVQRITIDGRRRDIGLGGYPTAGLRDAREKAAYNRTEVAAGRDPRKPKQTREVVTFQKAAQEYYDLNHHDWSSEQFKRSWWRSLELHVFPTIGEMQVDEVESTHVMQCLERLFKAEPSPKIETGHRVRGRINKVFEWCMAHNYISHNPADRRILYAIPKRRRNVTHMRSLSYRDCPRALERIEASNASLASKLCLRFIILTAVRYGEARYAVWSEIDWEGQLWRVPASRMKKRRDHTVPLSDASLTVLERAKEISDGSDLIFPSPLRPGHAISENTLTQLLKRIELHDRATVHGFRSSFRIWCEERTSASEAAKKLSLAHAVGNRIDQAYMRSYLFDQRRDLMQKWANHITGKSK